MGYYTDFTIKLICVAKDEAAAPYIIAGKYIIDVLVDELKSISGYTGFGVASDMTTVSLWSHKWYDHDDHMITISKNPLFADFILEVEGHGEDSADWWVTRYYRGKSETVEADINFEKFTIRP